MGHYGTSMERPTRTCQWDTLASSINNTHPAQYIHCISQFYSRGPALPEQSHISTVYSRGPALPDQSYISTVYSRGPALPDQSYMTDNLNNQQVQHAYLNQLNTHDM